MSLVGVWGFASSMFQENKQILNILYTLCMMVMFYACWTAIPILLSDVKRIDTCCDVSFLPLYVVVMLSLILGVTIWKADRLSGCFLSAAQAAWAASLCSIMSCHRALDSSGKKRVVFCIILVACLLCLALTRTRAHILGTGVALAYMVLHTKRWTYAAICVPSFLLLIYLHSPKSVESVQSFLRLSDTAGKVDTRSETWKESLPFIAESPLFGHGWLSRWEPETSSQRPYYNPDDDPHNATLTVAKAIGVPGGVLMLMIFGLLLRICFRRKQQMRVGSDHGATLLGGVILWTVIDGIFDNVLLSFGATTHRYTWMILALLLVRSGSANNQPRHRYTTATIWK